MPKFVVQSVNARTGEVMHNMDDYGVEEFETHEEAEDFRQVCYEGFSAGAETLKLAGRDYTDPEDVDFIVTEID